MQAGQRRYLILDCSDITSIDFSAAELVAAALDQLLNARTTVAAVAVPDGLADHLAERGHAIWVAPADAGHADLDLSDDDEEGPSGEPKNGPANAAHARNRPSQVHPESSDRPSTSVAFGRGLSPEQLPPGSHHWIPLSEWPTVDAAMEYVEFLCSEFHP